MTTDPNLSIPEGATPAGSPDTPFSAPPLRNMPGRRAGMTVWAGTGEVEYHGSTPPAAAPASSGAIRPTFQSPSGQSVMARDLGPDTLVVNPTTGAVESSLGALMAAGLIRETADGWELSGPDGRFHQTAPAAPAAAPEAPQRSEQGDHQDTREYLSREHETALVELEQRVTPETFASVEAFLVADQEIPDHVLAQVAEKIDGDRDAAIQAIETAVRPFVDQAVSVISSAVGEAGVEEVLEFGRSDPRGKELFRRAREMQANDRSTAGYMAMTHEWLKDLAMRDPARVAAGITSGGSKAKVVSGRVLVDLGDGQGWTEFTSALRGGVLGIGQPKRSRSR